MAEFAAQWGNSQELYQCVRWLAPKKHKQTIRLRTKTGDLMSPAEECAALHQHAVALFAGPETEYPRLLPLTPDLLEAERWEYALSLIKSNKAVPATEPSGQVWKEQRHTAAQELACIARQSLCADVPSIPQDWTTVQLIWLAKPGKTPSCPGNLRSIGLMPVDSKAFMIVLSTAAEPYIIAHLSDAPQYAYRAQAGTADALLRASQHCNEVRSLVGTHHQDHTAKILGVEAPLLSGGIMCNLDLAKAFDTVPHCDLYFSMVEAQIPAALAGAILHVYVQTVCIIDHGGRRKTAQMHRGIRQGCPLSPIIYACFTARFCRLLGAKLGQGWSGRHMTAFADDTHGFWMLRQVSDFKKAIIELRVMIDTLGSIGMTINFSKSVIAIIMRGNAAAGLYKKHFRHQHGAQHLRLTAQPRRDAYLPCAPKMVYLGAVLSYDNFEGQTVQHRVDKATSFFSYAEFCASVDP